MLTLAVLMVLVAPLVAAEAPSGAAPEIVAMERAVVDAVNEGRRREGLAPLIVDHELTRIARDHSCAMARGGFLAHTTPQGESLRDRVIKAGKRYVTIGENIARIDGRDPAARAVAGWLKSPSHRENIMSPGFTRVGVGACRSGRAVYFTQVFLRETR
jgi:uncharacterized protein YkwD